MHKKGIWCRTSIELDSVRLSFGRQEILRGVSLRAGRLSSSHCRAFGLGQDEPAQMREPARRADIGFRAGGREARA